MVAYIRLGSEVTVNKTYARSQYDSATARLANGNFVVVWYEADVGSSANRLLKAQIFAPGGAPIGGELILGSGGHSPTVAGLVNGGFVVAYANGGISARLFDDNGTALAPAFTVMSSSSTAYGQNAPDVAALSSGGFAIVWEDERTSGSDISRLGVHLRAYDQSGAAVGGDVLVNTATSRSQFDASIAAFADGGYVVTWTDTGAGGPIKAQIFGAGGTRVGGEFLISNSGSVASSVTILANGNFAVAWYESSQHHVQIYTPAGTPVGSRVSVAANLTGTQTGPELAALSDGGYAIAWMTEGSAAPGDGSGRAIAVQVYGADGAAIGDPRLANSQTNGDQREPDILALADGKFVVTWSDLNGTGGDDDEVKAQIFGPGVPVAISSNGGGDSAAVSVTENDSNAIATVAASGGGGTLTYRIEGGADSAHFAIDSQTGALSFIMAPDFEAPGDSGGDNVYEVVVSAGDGSSSDTQTIMVTVGDENERPRIVSNGGGTSASLDMAEGATAVTTVSAADPEGSTAIAYSITGGSDAALFAIDSATGALSLIAPADYEAPADLGEDNFLSVVVTASDGELSSFQLIQILIRNVNEGLAITSGSSALVVENGVAVQTVTAADIDGDAVTYSIAGGADAARFTIDAATGALSFVSAPDFEAPADSNGDNVYDVVVRASDGEFADERQLAVTVANSNEGVAITSAASAAILENQQAVQTVTATDADGDALTYSIAGGADAARFTIDTATGALSFVSAPDFEAPADADGNNVYDVVVRASDGELSDERQLSVTVGNANEAVTITSSGSVAVAETGTSAGTVAATDDDGDVLTYSIVGGADASRFAIDAATGALSFVSAPDFEAPGDSDGDNVYQLLVRASDGQASDERQLSVTVVNVNEGVSITSAASAAALENSIAVMTVTAADLDGEAISYSISGGADAARFTIDAASGALSFVSAPDFEAPSDSDGDNVYLVTVSASDGSLSDSRTVSVTVGGVNESVFFDTAFLAVSTGENDVAAATVSARDPEGAALSYSIVGGADSARFTIDATTGALRFVSAPDHEAPGDSDRDNVYAVVVAASDGTTSASQNVSVTVSNRDETLAIASYGGAASVSLSVSENGRSAAQMSAVDPDGDSVIYRIVGGDDALLFAVDSATGALTFVGAPDFEAPADSDRNNVYKVEVAAGSTAFSATQAFAISITNLNEGIAITSNGGGSSASVSVAENLRAVTTVAAVDPDGAAITYWIAGGADASRFTIDPRTGVLQFVAAPDHETPADADGNNLYDVIVAASDGELSDLQALSVAVTNTRDGRTVTGTSGGDSISATSTNTALRTTDAEDLVYGGDGHDTIQGMAGDDQLYGEAGKDVLTGGAGADWLSGGAGADQFVYNLVSDSTGASRDTIADFVRSQGDKISLSGIDANALVGGNQAFTFIGSGAFTKVAGQLRYEVSGGNTLILGDVDGDGIADLQIQVQGMLNLFTSDFVL